MKRPRHCDSSCNARLATVRRPAYESDEGPLTLSQVAAVREMASPFLPTGAMVSKQSLFQSGKIASMPDTSSSDRERILRAATELNGDPAVALDWYRCERIAVFDDETPEQLVNEGRTDDLLRYLRSLEAGFAG